MADRVEIIIRKPSPIDTAVSSVSSASPAAGKVLRWILPIIIILALGFAAYKIFPAVTSFVLSGFGEGFDYTITAKAIETFTDKGLEQITFTEKSGTKTFTLSSQAILDFYLYDGKDLNKETSFSASKGDTVTLTFEYIDGGGSAKILLNGERIFSDLRTTMKGVQLQYEDIKEQEIERTATQEGNSRIGRNGDDRKLVEVTAQPTGEKDGSLSETTYEVKTNNEKVNAWVTGGWLYAKYETTEPANAS